ncbi:IS66 family transposase [Paenibacillus sp. MSJ-34]|nr:IS66 family transposase [Paenibacillus sp. MSJ-34]
MGLAISRQTLANWMMYETNTFAVADNRSHALNSC